MNEEKQMKKVIICIGNEFHELVEDKIEFDCVHCSLIKYCAVSEDTTLCGFFRHKLSHFEKIRRRKS